MSLESIVSAGRDAADILKRSRSTGEALKALLPPRWIQRRVLNEGTPPTGAPEGAAIAKALKRLVNRLKAEALDLEAGRVRYEALRDSPAYAELVETSRALPGLRPEHLGDERERLAFWVNLYNVLVIHGIVAMEIRESVMEMPAFFGTVAYRIGDATFTPDEIENGVLRRNGKHPATGFRLFKADDPRLAYAPAAVDPRVHMALVCAAHSCPPISFYDAEHLDSQLDLAAANFVANDAAVDDAARTIELSVIFKYYAADFGGPDGVRDFLLKHSEGEHHEALERAYAAGHRITHARYDWSLNAVL